MSTPVFRTHCFSRTPPRGQAEWPRSSWRSHVKMSCCIALGFAFSLGFTFSCSPARAADGQLRQPIYPLAVAAFQDSDVLVADRMLPGLWKLKAGDVPEVFLTGGSAFRQPLNAIRSVAVAADGTTLVACSATRDIYRVQDNGKLTGLTGGKIGIPVDIAIHPDGHCFVSDLETQQIFKVPLAGGEPEALIRLAAPRGLCVDPAGRLWAVASSADAPLVRVASNGTIEQIVKTRAFSFPQDVLVDAAGLAYVSDSYDSSISRVDQTGAVTVWVKGEPLIAPVGMDWLEKEVLVADPRAGEVFAIHTTGQVRAFSNKKR